MASALERVRQARQAPQSSALDRVRAARQPQSVTYSNPEPGEVLRLPGVPPAPPSRPTITPPGTSEDFMRNLGKIDETIDRYGAAFARTVGHNLLPSLVEQETPEQGRMFDETMTQVALTLAGNMLGRAFGAKASDVIKYLGRGFKSRPEAAQFIASNPVRAATAAGQGVKAGDLLAPTISGSAVAAAVDAADPTPYNFTDQSVAGGAGLLTAAGVGRKTAEDLLLGNPRWQRIMMRPSAGTASGVLGALLGYAAAKGLIAGKDQINELVDYVASLFADEEDQTK